MSHSPRRPFSGGYLRLHWPLVTSIALGLTLALGVWQLDPTLRVRAGFGYALLLVATCAAVGVGADIVFTRRQRREFERERAAAERTRADCQSESARHAEAVEFFGAWVHEIKTPLAVIRLIAGRIESSELDREVERVEENLERALFFLRGTSFAYDYEVCSLDPQPIVKALVRSRSKLCIAKRLAVTADGPWFEVESDAKWLGFVIDQLLQNAIRYTPAGGTIQISMERSETEVRLRVCDSGVGIPPQELPRIFERSFTGTNGRDHGGATGLGLYLAQLICYRLSHRIEVTSTRGDGTVATIVFPCFGELLAPTVPRSYVTES